MTGFELVFAAFGLLLGLAVAEVLQGFARVIKMRRDARVGWLTPLLGLLVLLDLTSFWMTAWTMRALVPATLGTLMLVLAMVGGYYLLATLIFPDDPERWPDFDVYYDRHNRIVIGGMLAINLALFAVAIAVASLPAGEALIAEGPEAPRGGLAGALAIAAGVLGTAQLPLLAALLIVANRRLNVTLLALLILTVLLAAVVSAL